MAYEQTIVLVAGSGPTSFARIPRTDQVTQRRFVGSTVGLPSDLIVSGKVVKATDLRPVAIDQLTMYRSDAFVIPGTDRTVNGGVSMTMNIPRVFETEVVMNSFISAWIVNLLSYMHPSMSDAQAGSIRALLTGEGVNQLLNGIR